MTENEQVIIDRTKCIGCKKCVDECPANIISIEDEKAIRKNQRCILCGHCFAVCPENAISIPEYDCAEVPSEGMIWIDSDRFLISMKSRRSTRRFEKRPVEKELVNKLIEAARFCPTAKNHQDVFITVIENEIDSFEKEAVEVFKLSQTEELFCSRNTRHINIEESMFFHGAPLALLFSSKDPINASLASAYVELLANSMGLGCLFCAYFSDAVKSSDRLREMAEIPEKLEPVICLVIGYPDSNLKFCRVPPRKPSNTVMK